MSCTNPENEYEALVHIAARLAQRFRHVDEDAILVMIADELESFGSARLRDYVPNLVEHSVLRALSALSSDAA